MKTNVVSTSSCSLN